jgi:ankyrin repeat protein
VINGKTSDGFTALHLALLGGRGPLSMEFLARAVDGQERIATAPTRTGWRPLHFACHAGLPDVATELVRMFDEDVDCTGGLLKST